MKALFSHDIYVKIMILRLRKMHQDLFMRQRAIKIEYWEKYLKYFNEQKFPRDWEDQWTYNALSKEEFWKQWRKRKNRKIKIKLLDKQNMDMDLSFI